MVSCSTFFSWRVPATILAVYAGSRYWIPASYARLKEAENQLISSHVRAPHVATKMIAGHHTMEVSQIEADHVSFKSVFDEPNRERNVSVDKPVLVLLHGFGGGKALWVKNVDTLSEQFHVVAVDWLGCGQSDRPFFSPTTAEEAEVYFVKALEEWRQELGLDSFVLCGHSMGGMLASAYANAYPERIQHLMLASPAGVWWQPPLQEPESALGRAAVRLWNRNITPMWLVRAMGPMGPLFLRAILDRRFRFVPEESAIGGMDMDAVSDYCYHNWALPGSGEYAMGTLLGPFVRAHRPIASILLTGDTHGPSARYGLQLGEEDAELVSDGDAPSAPPFPVSFLYGGGRDWMSVEDGQKLSSALIEKGGRSDLHLVPDAGHQVFLDNYEGFNRLVLQAYEKHTKD